MRNPSPLRYPGGKARLAGYIQSIFVQNNLEGGTYVEPYAGGASVALQLLFSGVASHIHINDLDPSIFAFWHSVVTRGERFCECIQKAPLTIDEWHRQRDIYRSGTTDLFSRGFATFYLNRTNRSGIIDGAGVIGGQKQAGKYKMDARFPKDTLIRRIRRIMELSDHIDVSNLDALELLQLVDGKPQTFVYLDPPYFKKADRLYANFYQPEDHKMVRDAVAKLSVNWAVSYDAHNEIRELYRNFEGLQYPLQYSARTKYLGQELMFFSPGLKRPNAKSPIRYRPEKPALASAAASQR